jgi:glycosyltransferase involved in cell wall biosynthesis
MKNKINKKLRIVFLDFDDIRNPLLGAGQAKATREVAKRLVEKGHKVTVLCSKYPGCEERIENGIKYIHIGLGTKNVRLNNLGYIFSIPLTIRNIKNTDIIVECFTAPISTLMSPLFTKIPVVGLPTSFDAKRFAKLYHLPFELIERFGSKYYKYFIAFTPYLKNKMESLNPTVKTQIIPQGVSSEYFKIKNKKPEYILFIGRLDMDQKGLDLLLNSYAKVAKTVKFPLVIAGNGPDRTKVKDLIIKLNLKDSVRLVGFADEKNKLDLFSKAAFVAFPSRNEGFSLVSLEALASGLRLVSFDIPSLDWTDDRVARKVMGFNTDLYSKALSNESKYNPKFNVEKVCRYYAGKYSWKSVADKFESFFKEIIKEEKNDK